jgi:Tfp pilus assembly protein PilF
LTLRVVAVLAALVAAVSHAGAQGTPPTDTIAEARRLRDAGDYAAAAALLRPYTESHPEDPGTARFAALMSYWSKDVATARATYERALARHPNDADLRVELGQFLLDLGKTSRSREVVTPLVDSGPRLLPARRRALTILGTLDYWRGDFSSARRYFAETLQLDSTDADARRQLREIELASATWVSTGGTIWRDDQPLSHGAVELTGGWFATPVTPMTIRAASTHFSHDGIGEMVSVAEGTFSTFFPRARLDVSAAGGVVRRSFGEASDWTGRATLGARLPNHLVLGARAERAPYLYTTSSLTKSVMTQTVEGSARWRPTNGWMAEATARRESFDDHNDVSTAYAWVLAPLVRRPGGELHVGYSFAAQNASESRFVSRDELPFPPGLPPSTIPGVYDPYYTPSNLRVHSALASVRVKAGARWSLTGNGAYGFSARDDAPVLIPVMTPPNVTIVRDFSAREFTPWSMRGGVDGAVSEAVRLSLTAERGKAPYYTFTTVGLRLTYTFVAAARKRADRY